MNWVRPLVLPLVLSCAVHFLVLFFSPCYLYSYGGVGVVRNRLNVILHSDSILMHAREKLNESSKMQKQSTALQEREPSGVSRSDSEKEPLTSEDAWHPSLPSGYFPGDNLTVAPKALTDPVLEADDPADYSIMGTIVLKLWISEKGDVIYTEVGHTDLSERSALVVEKAFQKIRFIPGELNGKRVGTVLQVEVNYENSLLPEE